MDATNKTDHKPLTDLVRRERNSVAEGLTMGGDLPSATAANATSQDWQSVLIERYASLAEACRFDENDIEVQRMIRVQLAKIIATCQAWDKQLTSE